MTLSKLILLIAFAQQVASEELTEDGLPFTINQKDYRPPKFTMYGRGEEFYDTQGFVSTDYLPLDHRGYSTILANCDFEKIEGKPFYQHSSVATLIYYEDSPSYDLFDGYDLIPENTDSFIKGGPYSHLKLDTEKKFSPKPIEMQRCRIPQKETGGAWHVERIGPVRSTGGYSWVQIGWDDVGFLSEALEQHPDGIDVDRYAFLPVLEDGTRLNHPPIHIHHTHVVTHPGVRFRMSPIPLCLKRTGLGIPFLDNLVRDDKCYNMTLFMEQHGDYISQPEEDGIESMIQGDHNPRRINKILDIEAEFNDERPSNSEPMDWYLLVAVRWKPMDLSKEPLSFNGILSPPHVVPTSQLQNSGTFPTPTDEATMLTYSDRHLETGDVVRVKIHAHSEIFESGMVFEGTYEDLGLADARFFPKASYLPHKITTDLGFKDTDQVANYILDHLKVAQDNWDLRCTGSTQVRSEVCSRPRPEWKCGAVVDIAEVEFNGVTYEFDRHPKTWCKPWKFVEGNPFVAVAFSKKITKPPSPVHPDKIPPFYPSHFGLMVNIHIPGLKYSSENAQLSTYRGALANGHLMFSPPQLLARAACVFLFAGAPNDENTIFWLEQLVMLIFTTIVLGLGYLAYKCNQHKVDQHFDFLRRTLNHKYEPVQQVEEEEDEEY